MAISLLTTDVLPTIFEFATASAGGNPSIRDAPLNVSHTCRTWRELAIGHGWLWRHLDCRFREIHPRLASMWLERSKELLLDYRLNQYLGDNRKEVEEWHRRLARRQRQWSIIHMHFSHGLAARMTPSRLSDLPKLTRWILWDILPFEAVGRPVASITPLFFIPPPSEVAQPLAPALTELVCNGLEGGTRTLRGLLNMFQQCPNLEDVKLSQSTQGRDEAFGLSSTQSTCVLPVLRNLELSGRFGRLLRRLKAPALQSFQVDAKIWPISSACLNVAEFLSSTNVRVATFTGYADERRAIQEREVLQLLSSMHSVQTLRLKYAATAFVCELLHSEGQHLCPQLEKLFMTFEDGADAKVVERMLSARYRLCPKFLASINVRDWFEKNQIDSQTKDTFKDWENQGSLVIYWD